MKKWKLGPALALALMAGTPALATAQSAVGARAGMRWSQLESSQEAGSISSLAIGGYFGFGISHRLAIQLEAIYGTRGADALRVGAGELDPTAEPSRVELSYIEVPVLLRAGFPGERFLPSFFLGPYVGFLLDCEIQPAGGETRACDSDTAPERFHPRSTDFGLVLGGGLDMAFGESTVFVDARYSLGLQPIQSGGDGFDARHTGFTVSGGVAVPLGR